MADSCIIIGGGLAGMVAARRLQQLGVQPVVLERGADEGGTNNARISGGLLHVAWAAMDETPEYLYKRLMDETDGEIDPALAQAFARNSRRALDWLAAEGAEIKPKSESVAYMRHALSPHMAGIGRRQIPGRGPEVTMLSLYRSARDSGAELILGASAEGLGSVGADGWAVSYRQDGRTTQRAARAVLVADGGFQASAELLTRYVGPNAALCALRAQASSTGAGLRMLTANGAATVGLGRVYGHMLSLHALTNDMLWPYPPVDKLSLQGVLVDRTGLRFPTLADNGVQLVTELARTEDPRGYVVVLDTDLWNTAGRDNPYGTPVPNPDLVERGGVLYTANSLEGLAEQMGVDPQRLARSVAAHNGEPGRVAVARPPYHALPVVPGITFTMGGVKTAAGCQVLNELDQPIQGLYAAGGAVGGLHGGPRGGYVGGLAVSLVFGLLAAESIAGYVAA